MKKLFFLVLTGLFCNFLHAQEEGEKEKKFFTGGNFGLTFGRYTILNVSPQIGYRFNRFVSAGLGLNLQYASVKETYGGQDYSKTSQGITGINLFGRFYPVQTIFLQAQPELNYIFGKIKFYQPPQSFKLDTEIVPCFLVGGGYAVPVGKGSFLTTVLYDVMQRPNSPYGNQPIVNFGYNQSF